MVTTAIPQALCEITPRWLNDVLQPAGILDGHTIIGCEIHSVGEEFGFASRVARLALTFDSPAPQVPSSLIVKLATSSSDPERTALLREKCLREAAFYSQIGSSAGIPTPRCYHAACDKEGDALILLLEDLSASRLGDEAKGCSMRETQSAVDGLAAFHARWWKSAALSGYAWLPFYGDAELQIERLQRRRSAFFDKYAEWVSPEVKALTGSLGPRHLLLLQSLQDPPETLIHVDTHLDNMAFVDSEQGIRVVLFDWQGVSKGLGVVDLALFLASASTNEQPDDNVALLKRYHDGLIAHGVEDYSFDRLARDYRVAVLRRWIGTVNGLGTAYAKTWTSRQAELARRNVVKWGNILTNCHVAELLQT